MPADVVRVGIIFKIRFGICFGIRENRFENVKKCMMVNCYTMINCTLESIIEI